MLLPIQTVGGFMKSSLILVLMVFAQNLMAAECVDSTGKDIISQPEVFTPLIEKAKSCYEAVEMAEACAWGSSIDVSTAATAYTVCEVELSAQNPTEKLTSLLETMEGSCAAKYENEEGSMYRSMHMYCNLSAIEWITTLATPN